MRRRRHSNQEFARSELSPTPGALEFFIPVGRRFACLPAGRNPAAGVKLNDGADGKTSEDVQWSAYTAGGFSLWRIFCCNFNYR